MTRRLSEYYRNNKCFIPMAVSILLSLVVLNIWYWQELKRKKEELFFNEVSLYNQIIQSGIVNDRLCFFTPPKNREIDLSSQK